MGVVGLTSVGFFWSAHILFSKLFSLENLSLELAQLDVHWHLGFSQRLFFSFLSLPAVCLETDVEVETEKNKTRFGMQIGLNHI